MGQCGFVELQWGLRLGSHIAASSAPKPKINDMGLINHPRPITLQLAAHLGTFAPLLSGVFPLALNAPHGPGLRPVASAAWPGQHSPHLAPGGPTLPSRTLRDLSSWSVGSRRRGHAALDNAHAALARRGRSVAGWVPRGLAVRPKFGFKFQLEVPSRRRYMCPPPVRRRGWRGDPCGAGQSWKCRPVTQWQSQSLVVPPCEHQSPTWQIMIGF